MLYFLMPILKIQHKVQIYKEEIMIKLTETTSDFRNMVLLFQWFYYENLLLVYWLRHVEKGRFTLSMCIVHG